MLHRPVCKKCECEFRPEENGVGCLDMFNPSDHSEPQPYQIWDADLWKCPKCGIEIVIGFGQQPIAEHWEGDSFTRTMGAYLETQQVIKNYPVS